jgi:hypothetical protein
MHETIQDPETSAVYNDALLHLQLAKRLIKILPPGNGFSDAIGKYLERRSAALKGQANCLYLRGTPGSAEEAAEVSKLSEQCKKLASELRSPLETEAETPVQPRPKSI